MNHSINSLVSILNINKDLVKESINKMLKTQNINDVFIINQTKILILTLIITLINIGKGNIDIKFHKDILFYRKMFYYIFTNISMIKEKKSIIKQIYLHLNNIKKQIETNLNSTCLISTRTNENDYNNLAYGLTDSSDSSNSDELISVPIKIIPQNHNNLNKNNELYDKESSIKSECYKILELLKILVTTLNNDISKLYDELNIKEPSDSADIGDIDFINKLINIFFIQYRAMISNHYNIFVNTQTNLTKINIDGVPLTFNTLDTLNIHENSIEGNKVLVLNLGKCDSIIYYINNNITNNILQDVLTKNINNLSVAISIINTNLKLIK